MPPFLDEAFSFSMDFIQAIMATLGFLWDMGTPLIALIKASLNAVPVYGVK